MTAPILSAKLTLQSLNVTLPDGTSNTKERNNFLKMFQFAGMTFRWFCKAINETFPMDPANPTMVGIYRFRIFFTILLFSQGLAVFFFYFVSCFIPPASLYHQPHLLHPLVEAVLAMDQVRLRTHYLPLREAVLRIRQLKFLQA